MALRLADLLAGLSRFADLGFGLRPGEAVRSCLLATMLGRSLGLSDAEVQSTYYTALLQHVGCTGFAHETTALFGDDLQTNVAAARTGSASRDVVGTFLPTLLQGRPAADRLRLTWLALVHGSRWGAAYVTAACEVGREAARRLGLPADVSTSLQHVYETWSGGNAPDDLSGEEIPLPARLARLSGIAVLFDTVGGPDLATNEVRRRAGTMLDPQLAAAFTARAADLIHDLDSHDAAVAVLAAEPDPVVLVPPEQLVQVAHVFADLVDLKSPWFLGHSRAVATLVVAAAERLHLQPAEVRELEVAGLLHDLGRSGVSNAIWDKPAPLDLDEREQAHLHPYYSERILAGSPSLRPLAQVVGRHHERLDGSGYHRGCAAPDLSLPARLLATADAYTELRGERPYRPAFDADEAAERLQAHARRGALDADCVHAVLGAAGHSAPVPRVPRPAGLSEREVEVLGLVARGCSNAEIASALVISRRTAEHHVQHVYAKIGSSSRAAAALFALEHHLLPRTDHRPGRASNR